MILLITYIITIAKSIPTLESLELQQCQQLTHHAIAAAIDAGGLQKLTHLHLHHLESLCDDVWHSFAQLTLLSHLRLEGTQCQRD